MPPNTNTNTTNTKTQTMIYTRKKLFELEKRWRLEYLVGDFKIEIEQKVLLCFDVCMSNLITSLSYVTVSNDSGFI